MVSEACKAMDTSSQQREKNKQISKHTIKVTPGNLKVRTEKCDLIEDDS